MAVTVASILSAANVATSAATTTGSFTPSNGVLLVACAFLLNPSFNKATNNTLTDSLGGTWTNRVLSAVDECGIHMWTRPVVTGASMTVSFNNTQGAFEAKQLQVLAVAGANNTSPIGASVIDTTLGDTTGAMTLSAAPASTSAVIAARCLVVGNDAEVAAATPGSGWTEHFDQNSVDRGGMETQSRISSTSTSVVWVDVNVNNVLNETCSGWAFEFVQAAGGANRMSTNVNYF